MLFIICDNLPMLDTHIETIRLQIYCLFENDDGAVE